MSHTVLNGSAGNPCRQTTAVTTHMLVFFSYLITALAITAPTWLAPTTYLWGMEPDNGLFVWMLHWWPYALSHGYNPFHTSVVCHPGPFNIVKTTSIPFVSLMMWPITKTFGAIFSYNLAIVLSFALAAWACFDLCFYITEGRLPTFISGLFFGFSGYMQTHTLVGHLNLVACVFLLLLMLKNGLKLINDEYKRLAL